MAEIQIIKGGIPTMEMKIAMFNITVLELSTYPPELSQCDFYLFLRLNLYWKEQYFTPLKKKRTSVMSEVTEEDLQHCCDQWKICIGRCRDRRGIYNE